MVLSLAGDMTFSLVGPSSSFKVLSFGSDGFDVIGLGPWMTKLPKRSDSGERTLLSLSTGDKADCDCWRTAIRRAGGSFSIPISTSFMAVLSP
jgi:hypothetical protein